MSEVKETKKIVLSVLAKQVEDGMKKVELAKFYGLPMTQMTKVLQQAGLKIRKFHLPAFVLENDLVASEEVANLAPIAPETVVAEEAPVAEVIAEEVVEAVVEEVAATEGSEATEEAPVVEEAAPVANGGWGDVTEEKEDDTLENLLPR